MNKTKKRLRCYYLLVSNSFNSLDALRPLLSIYLTNYEFCLLNLLKVCLIIELLMGIHETRSMMQVYLYFKFLLAVNQHDISISLL